MRGRRTSNPTGAELRILRVLWNRGRATVREVAADLNADEPTGYTTALKFLQIMTAKGLVRREEAGRAHVYEAACSREATQGQLVRHLLDRAFDGSASTLVLRALSEARTDPGELTRIRAMLRQVTRRKP